MNLSDSDISIDDDFKVEVKFAPITPKVLINNINEKFKNPIAHTI